MLESRPKGIKMKNTLVAAILCCILATTAFAAATHRYRCPKCGLIQEYKTPGSKKCPNDGRTMIRAN